MTDAPEKSGQAPAHYPDARTAAQALFTDAYENGARSALTHLTEHQQQDQLTLSPEQFSAQNDRLAHFLKDSTAATVLPDLGFQYVREHISEIDSTQAGGNGNGTIDKKELQQYRDQMASSGGDAVKLALVDAAISNFNRADFHLSMFPFSFKGDGELSDREMEQFQEKRFESHRAGKELEPFVAALNDHGRDDHLMEAIAGLHDDGDKPKDHLSDQPITQADIQELLKQHDGSDLPMNFVAHLTTEQIDMFRKLDAHWNDPFFQKYMGTDGDGIRFLELPDRQPLFQVQGEHPNRNAFGGGR